jgi:hypothetical protein
VFQRQAAQRFFDEELAEHANVTARPTPGVATTTNQGSGEARRLLEAFIGAWRCCAARREG